MRDLILKGIRHSITLFAKWLGNRDDDNIGWDDAMARVLECISMIIEQAEKGEAISKKTVVLSLEVAQIIAENIDQNTTGVDDAIAFKIGKIKAAIDVAGC